MTEKSSGHGSRERAPIAPQRRLGSKDAEVQRDQRTPERPGNRSTQLRLTNTTRTEKAKNVARGVTGSVQDCEILDNPFLLLFIGVTMPTVFYILWGLIELTQMPVAQ